MNGEKHFLQECDYRTEAENQRRFVAIFSKRKRRPHSHNRRRIQRRQSASPRLFSAANRSSASFLRRASFRAAAPPRRFWTFTIAPFFTTACFTPIRIRAISVFDGHSVGFLDFGRVQRLSQTYVSTLRRQIRAVLSERDHRKAVHETLLAFDLARGDYDFDAGYRAVQCFYRFALGDAPFAFTPDYLKRQWDAFMGKNKNRFRVSYPRDMVFFNQLFFGLSALLARLRAPISCHKMMIELVYDKGEPRPKPYSAAELSEVDL